MTKTQNEIFRHATLEALAACFPVPRLASGLRRIVAREVPFEFSDEELNAALEFHRGLGRTEFEFDPAGSSKWWKATSAGVLHVERT